MKSDFFKKIIFALLMLAWMIPAVKTLFPSVIPITPDPLHGEAPAPVQPTFTWEDWLNGKFQQIADEYIVHTVGFKNFFIRARNQFDYSILRKGNAAGVIVGEDHFLFDERYIFSAMGNNFIGENKIAEKVQTTRLLRDELKKRNIDLVILIAPGKGFYYRELIPSRYHQVNQTNYELFAQKLSESGMHVIDFNKYCLEQKGKSPYILLPKTGVHWSSYTGALAGDSLVRYIEKIRNIDMPDIIKEGIEISDTSRSTDNDIGQALNLFYTLQNPPMAYFKLKFEDNPNKYRPRVLTVGDSFYWNIFTLNIPHNTYKNSDFWYYNKQHFILDQWLSTPVEDINMKEFITNQEVIVIVETEANFDDFGFGFIEKAYDILKGSNPHATFLEQIPEGPTPVLKDSVEKYLGKWLDKKGKTTYRQGLHLLWTEDGTWKDNFKERWRAGYVRYINGGVDNSDFELVKKEGFKERNFATYLIPHIIWWANH